jgi:uncharacterized protein (DUF433 family)
LSEILAFSAEQVCRLTGLSQRQLRYWDETGFFRPQPSDEPPGRAFGRIYFFRDLVNLRVVALLRKHHHVPLQELRAVGARLAECPESSWATLTLYVSGSHVFFDDPRIGARMSARHPKQTVLPIEMERVAAEMRAASEGMLRRSPEEIGHIEQKRYVAHNAPVLSGTRVPTTAIWNLHRAGYSTSAIIAEYPRLKPEDITAAIEYEEQARQRRAG